MFSTLFAMDKIELIMRQSHRNMDFGWDHTSRTSMASTGRNVSNTMNRSGQVARSGVIKHERVLISIRF